MTNDKAPDNATGDSVILARVHTFLAALLTFLGFGNVPDMTVAGMLDDLTGWLDMAKAIRRDPQGATARIWWEAFKDAWKSVPSPEAGTCADAAVAEFGKRFLPVADDGRDTFDTADFEALRVECDRLDANIAILESRADDLQQNLDSIIAERNALLKTNAHHASEVELLRQERDELKTQLAGAIVPLPKPERVAPGQRWLWQTYEPKFLLPKRAVAEQKERNKRGHLSRIGITSNPLHDDNWIYLGTENA